MTSSIAQCPEVSDAIFWAMFLAYLVIFIATTFLVFWFHASGLGTPWSMAPFKHIQRTLQWTALLLLFVGAATDWRASAALAWFCGGCVACTALEAITEIGDRLLAEKLGYKCRDCGQRYSPNGMLPVPGDPLHEEPREPR